MESKPWYQSKTIWAGVIGLLIVVYNAVEANLGIKLPTIPEYVFGILAAFGIYGRVGATTSIK
jgi:uncharacterized membrane protein